jgi:hypothetical protein
VFGETIIPTGAGNTQDKLGSSVAWNQGISFLFFSGHLLKTFGVMWKRHSSELEWTPTNQSWKNRRIRNNRGVSHGGPWEAEAGGSWVQASLDYIVRICIKNKYYKMKIASLKRFLNPVLTAMDCNMSNI